MQQLCPAIQRSLFSYTNRQTQKTGSSDSLSKAKAKFVRASAQIMNSTLARPGKNIDFIPYERNGKTIRRPVDKTIPKPSTLHSVEALLLKFLKYCEQYIRHIPKFEKVKVVGSPRASFTPEEVHLIESEASRKIEDSTLTRSQRFQACLLYHYIGILAATGMRPTECLRLKWQQITKFDPRYEGPDRKSKTVILIYGKGKHREGFGLDSVDIHLKGLWLLYVWFWDREPTKEDFLWSTEAGTQFKRLDILLNRLLDIYGRAPHTSALSAAGIHRLRRSRILLAAGA